MSLSPKPRIRPVEGTHDRRPGRSGGAKPTRLAAPTDETVAAIGRDDGFGAVPPLAGERRIDPDAVPVPDSAAASDQRPAPDPVSAPARDRSPNTSKATGLVGRGRHAAVPGPAPEPAIGSPAALGRLFIVATPIGNLGDVTYRAIEILRTVPLVAAEDTRLTRRLFARYEIATHLVSYHAQSGEARQAQLVAHLRAGRDLALVTDAGTPLVSDPGAELAGAWTAEGGVVVPVPGASAVLAALVASGLSAARWAFEGFLPRSGRERKERLERIAADERACVVYEAPSRVPATLADLAAVAGGQRRAAVCRELTKLHEEVIRGPLRDLAVQAEAGRITLRGEFAIVIEAVSEAAAAARPGAPQPASLDDARQEVARLVSAGARHSEAVRQVAASTGLNRREIYKRG